MDQMSKDFENELTYAGIRRPVETATTLDPEVYRSETFYQKEQEKVFARSWVCVGYTSQLKEPGSLYPTQVAGQPILLCKNKEGKIRGFFNVCRHRGSLLVTAETRADKIRCPYHSWVYGLDGELQACPLFRDSNSSGDANFQKNEYGLISVRVETWGCFIFVNLDEHAMPLSQYLADMIPDYRNFPLKDLVLVRRKKYSVHSNWKLVAENFLEYYHLPWVHPELCTVTAIDLHKRNQGTGMYMSFYASPLLQGGTPIDAKFLPPIPGLSPDEANSGYFPLIFPNVAMFLMPHHLFSLILQPRSAGETEEFGDLLVHPEVLELPDAQRKIDEIVSFYDMVNLQDVAAVERVQRGIQAKAYPGGRMSYRFEEPLHRFQNMIANYMLGKPTVPPGDPIARPADNPGDSASHSHTRNSKGEESSPVPSPFRFNC